MKGNELIIVKREAPILILVKFGKKEHMEQLTERLHDLSHWVALFS